MMFQTKFICILTAGHTVDGREIAQETLNQIAETYNPDVYNARINIDHSQYSSKLGSVLEVKVEGAKLLAKLKPNDFFLYLVQQGQYLHTSCEIVGDFAKTGKAYLTGLAVTDNPASLGTTEMHLSAQQPGAEFYCSNEFITSEKPTLLNKIFNPKDDEMSDKATLEMLSQINATQSSTATALTALADNMTKISESLSKKTAEIPVPEGGDESSEVTKLSEKLDTLSTHLSKQKETISGLTEKLAAITDEPGRLQATGGDQDQDDVL